MSEPVDESIEDILKATEQERQSPLYEDAITIAEKIYQLWWNWANFELFIIAPTFDVIDPPLVIKPEPLINSEELEFVYPIYDYGFKLSTSKAEEMFIAGKSMCKLNYTIEKMIFILIERLKAEGISAETEVQISFVGHEVAKRKAFESVINLNYNVLVTNFDPGPWGERYLQNVKVIGDKGYGYPSEAPRDNYRQSHGSGSNFKR